MSLDLDSILDSSIDDLADLPEFAVFPAGVHRVTISWEQKEVNNHPSIELKMRMVETVELANPESDTPPAAGSECSVLFMMDNEFGQGKLKQVVKPIAAAVGASNIKAAIENSKGMEIQVVTRVRQNKDKTQSYADITKVIV